jgi:hypothetical protein
MTPAQEMKQFISNRDYQKKIEEKLIQEGYEKNLVLNTIEDFVNYWTELTPSGKKQKWQLQQTFELNRRLKTWLRNITKYNYNNKNNIIEVNSQQVTNELLARRKDNAIKNCGKCKNGFILKNGVASYCECIKNLK